MDFKGDMYFQRYLQQCSYGYRELPLFLKLLKALPLLSPPVCIQPVFPLQIREQSRGLAPLSRNSSSYLPPHSANYHQLLAEGCVTSTTFKVIIPKVTLVTDNLIVTSFYQFLFSQLPDPLQNITLNPAQLV